MIAMQRQENYILHILFYRQSQGHHQEPSPATSHNPSFLRREGSLVSTIDGRHLHVWLLKRGEVWKKDGEFGRRML